MTNNWERILLKELARTGAIDSRASAALEGELGRRRAQDATCELTDLLIERRIVSPSEVNRLLAELERQNNVDATERALPAEHDALLRHLVECQVLDAPRVAELRRDLEAMAAADPTAAITDVLIRRKILSPSRVNQLLARLETAAAAQPTNAAAAAASEVDEPDDPTTAIGPLLVDKGAMTPARLADLRDQLRKRRRNDPTVAFADLLIEAKLLLPAQVNQLLAQIEARALASPAASTPQVGGDTTARSPRPDAVGSQAGSKEAGGRSRNAKGSSKLESKFGRGTHGHAPKPARRKKISTHTSLLMFFGVIVFGLGIVIVLLKLREPQKVAPTPVVTGPRPATLRLEEQRAALASANAHANLKERVAALEALLPKVSDSQLEQEVRAQYEAALQTLDTAATAALAVARVQIDEARKQEDLFAVHAEYRQLFEKFGAAALNGDIEREYHEASRTRSEQFHRYLDNGKSSYQTAKYDHARSAFERAQALAYGQEVDTVRHWIEQTDHRLRARAPTTTPVQAPTP
ncbi:MAG: hypothetical protein ACKVX7_00585 [Planctomycetota bacterium]